MVITEKFVPHRGVNNFSDLLYGFPTMSKPVDTGRSVP